MPERDPKTGRFLPGHSGNPKGRPKSSAYLIELLDKLAHPSEDGGETDLDVIVRKLVELAKKGNMVAIRCLLERVGGKPHQASEVVVSVEKPILRVVPLRGGSREIRDTQEANGSEPVWDIIFNESDEDDEAE